MLTERFVARNTDKKLSVARKREKGFKKGVGLDTPRCGLNYIKLSALTYNKLFHELKRSLLL